jgi:predicted nucleotidyltransferase
MNALPVSPEMHALIQDELHRISRAEGIKVLFAIESGSRAWGFHSHDSDYDVRFVYARPVDWHLRLQDRRDVLEYPISGDLDISGWEVGKALRLALRSNAVLPEWLQSPITYTEDAAARAEILCFCGRVLTRRSVTWHYLSLATRQMEGLRLPNGQIKLKRYLYTIRPVLALRYMRLHDSAMPPMDMTRLMAACALPESVCAYLDDMIAVKRQAGEMGTAASTDVSTDALIENEIAAARDWIATHHDSVKPQDWDDANRLHVLFTYQAIHPQPEST